MHFCGVNELGGDDACNQLLNTHLVISYRESCCMFRQEYRNACVSGGDKKKNKPANT